MKTVNSKGLDLRLRVPPGFDAVEVKARSAIAARIARGACSAGLSAKRADAAGSVRIDRAALDRLLDPEYDSVTLSTLRKAAVAVGREIRLELV